MLRFHLKQTVSQRIDKTLCVHTYIFVQIQKGSIISLIIAPGYAGMQWISNDSVFSVLWDEVWISFVFFRNTNYIYTYIYYIYMYTYVRTLVNVFYTRYLELFLLKVINIKKKKEEKRKKWIINLCALCDGTLSLKIHCD